MKHGKRDLKTDVAKHISLYLLCQIAIALCMCVCTVSLLERTHTNAVLGQLEQCRQTEREQVEGQDGQGATSKEEAVALTGAGSSHDFNYSVRFKFNFIDMALFIHEATKSVSQNIKQQRKNFYSVTFIEKSMINIIHNFN